MNAVLISIVSALGAAVAATATSGCIFVWVDEPKTPKSILEK